MLSLKVSRISVDLIKTCSISITHTVTVDGGNHNVAYRISPILLIQKKCVASNYAHSVSIVSQKSWAYNS